MEVARIVASVLSDEAKEVGRSSRLLSFLTLLRSSRDIYFLVLLIRQQFLPGNGPAV